MADYISTLNGSQMDAALLDMADHNSEAWAVGERNGVPVDSADVTYHNNAQYYAQQAQSIAPASVTEAVRWDIAQTALTDTNKAQARENIDAGKNGAWTNPNLLDNWYFVGGGSQLGDGVFPINQRGQTSYGTSMYTVDRWRTWSDMAVGVTASGLSLTSTNSGGGLFQYPQQSKVANAIGQQMTFSVELNGTIYSATGQVYLGAWIPIDIPITGVSAIFVVPSNYPSELISVSVRMDGAISTPVLFTRAKLELGTVSTLANDVPPNFGEELRKCQRYLRYIPFVRVPTPIEGTVASLTLINIPMRTVPTPSLATAGGVLDGYSLISITSATVVGYAYETVTIQFALASTASSTIGYIYDTTLCLSAEL